MKSAEEFFDEWGVKRGYTSIDECDDIAECMIEFAKLHVTEVLKELGDKVDIIDKKSILSIYPLDKIK